MLSLAGQAPVKHRGQSAKRTAGLETDIGVLKLWFWPFIITKEESDTASEDHHHHPHHTTTQNAAGDLIPVCLTAL